MKVLYSCDVRPQSIMLPDVHKWRAGKFEAEEAQQGCLVLTAQSERVQDRGGVDLSVEKHICARKKRDCVGLMFRQLMMCDH